LDMRGGRGWRQWCIYITTCLSIFPWPFLIVVANAILMIGYRLLQSPTDVTESWVQA
jgi:hypothetical protein